MSFWSGLGDVLKETGKQTAIEVALITEYSQKSDQALLNEYISLQIAEFDEEDSDEVGAINRIKRIIESTLKNRGYYKVSYFVNPEELE